MHEGDQCRETKHGSTTAGRDYSAQKSDNSSTGWIGGGMGALFLVGGAVVLVLRLGKASSGV